MEIKTLKKLLRGLGEHGFRTKYKLIKALNNGGNSHSYKAFSYALQKNVFIKFFLLPRHEIELLKFRNEIAIHKLIARQGDAYHENAVIDFIEYKLFKNNLGGYLVIEWLEGKSLDIVIEEYAHKSIDQKIQLFHRVANSFIPLSNWITHRDLHPSNIMVLNGDFEYVQLKNEPFNTQIKIVDFGESYSEYVEVVSDLVHSDLKKIYESNARRLTTSLYSTPPEYLNNYKRHVENLSYRSNNYDSWALGLIGFKIFFNEDLFEFKDIKDYVNNLQSIDFKDEIINKIHYKFSRLEHKNSELLKHIFIHLLRLNPTERVGDGNIGLVLNLTGLRGYELPENMEPTDYLRFVREGWYFLDAKGLTRLEDKLSYD